jgi:YVTN family beta-propeller protein
VAVTPDGSKVYVANSNSNTVSVIATASNAVVATITVGAFAPGVAVTPDGSRVYVANSSKQHRVGDRHGDQRRGRHDHGRRVDDGPIAFGLFIPPAWRSRRTAAGCLMSANA